MAIKLRTVKGTPLTAADYDEALSQLIYSASTEGANGSKVLLLHYTGSNGISYSPRSSSIAIPEYNYWTISDGSNTEFVYNTGTVVFSGSKGVTTTYSPGANKLHVEHDTVSLTSNTSNASPNYGETFTAIDSITTNTGGHVTAINTKTVTLPVSSSYALTASYALNANGIGLNTKVGNVPSSSFYQSGSGGVAQVTFATPFSSSNYEVALEVQGTDSINGMQGYIDGVIDKNENGFKIFGVDAIAWGSYPGSSVSYIAIANGETAVTSSFTELASTASYATFAQTTADRLSTIVTLTPSDLLSLAGGNQIEILPSSSINTNQSFFPYEYTMYLDYNTTPYDFNTNLALGYSTIDAIHTTDYFFIFSTGLLNSTSDVNRFNYPPTFPYLKHQSIVLDSRNVTTVTQGDSTIKFQIFYKILDITF